MIPVMPSTNIDRSKIDLAGVDSGAKMLEIPVEPVSAAAATTNHNRKAKMETRAQSALHSRLASVPFSYGPARTSIAAPATPSVTAGSPKICTAIV